MNRCSTMKPRLIALYLPQYHPIPENDAWWGKGFTEWSNVAKARPLFKGHYQPHIPADLGFYDLRVPETRQAQADMAREYGIYGFCYYHYWFNGKQLLERPFSEVLNSGVPDFPFCLCWANQTWSGIWHGAPDRVLIEQTYPGVDDHTRHFQALLPAFTDERYIRVDGKPLLAISKPSDLPNASETISLWQKLAVDSGLKGLFIVGLINDNSKPIPSKDIGFDGFSLIKMSWERRETKALWRYLIRLFGKESVINLFHKIVQQPFRGYDFSKMADEMVSNSKFDFEYFPCILPNWDNSPRSGLEGFIGVNSTPSLFKEQLVKAIKRIEDYPPEHQVIFIKSWNEWAEGNYLEPDIRYGKQFLQAVLDGIVESLGK